MSKLRKPDDPFAQREAENYSNPIPSREHILEHLERLGEPVSHAGLCEQLNLVEEQQVEALRRRLIAMSRDGQLISNRRGVYGLAAHMDLGKGRIQGNKDGFGFFIPDDGSGDLFLNAREMEKLFDGDRVLARLAGIDSRGRKEGIIVEILERRYSQIVGRFYQEQGFGLVVADSKRITQEILIPEKNIGKAKDGEFVVAQLTEYPSRRRKAIGEIVEVLGDSRTPGMEIEVAVRSHDIPHVWPSDVIKETKHFADHIQDEDMVGRFDLRHIPFITIDGEDAKDFDDAVFAERHQRGNWTLYVAIADVSHYVSVGSALDVEAANRGTSVYFPGHVIPMLPEKLSNGLCSLKPNVDRLTMVAEMDITPDGEMSSYCFYEAVIHSHGRMTYTEVANIVQDPKTPTEENLRKKLRERHRGVVDHLENLHGLYRAFRGARETKGAIDFDSTETRIVFSEDRKIREIVPVERNDAHRMIEECMLCANVAAAELLGVSELPALYRVHEGPNPEKLDNLRKFLNELGLYLSGGEKPKPADYSKVLQQIGERPDRHLLQMMLIRSMMQAVYQPENLGHFGLGFSAYAHFTSPIRRYPDLLIHRGIRYLVRNKSNANLRKQKTTVKLNKNSIYPYTINDMENLGQSCSTAERRADAASYSVLDWLKCEYMQDRVGDEFTGTVSSVTSFGLFGELNDIYIEGLVHITELSNDYYHFDPVHHILEGERTRKTYRLGDSVDVKVVRVDLDDKKIDLQMVGVNREVNTGRRKSSRSLSGSKERKANDKKIAKPKLKSKSNKDKKKVSGHSNKATTKKVTNNKSKKIKSKKNPKLNKSGPDNSKFNISKPNKNKNKNRN